MNEVPANPPLLAPPSPGRSLTRRKLFLLVVLGLAAQLACIAVLETKKTIIPRSAVPVPHLQLVASANELVALNDPTLFALPHANDFATAFWQRLPAPPLPAFRWTEPAGELALTATGLGATFRQFMRTNPLAAMKLNFKIPPNLSEVTAAFDNGLPQVSTLQIIGDLATRRLLRRIEPESLGLNDVIPPPSHVQVLVAETGNVLSAVRLSPDNYLEATAHNELADQAALKLARQLRFAPDTRPMLGEIIFTWHTVPTHAP